MLYRAKARARPRIETRCEDNRDRHMLIPVSRGRPAATRAPNRSVVPIRRAGKVENGAWAIPERCFRWRTGARWWRSSEAEQPSTASVSPSAALPAGQRSQRINRRIENSFRAFETLRPVPAPRWVGRDPDRGTPFASECAQHPHGSTGGGLGMARRPFSPPRRVRLRGCFRGGETLQIRGRHDGTDARPLTTRQPQCCYARGGSVGCARKPAAPAGAIMPSGVYAPSDLC